MLDLWDPKALAPLPFNPEGRFYRALQDIPLLGIKKGQEAYTWRSSMIYVIVPGHETLTVMARALNWDPETFSEFWAMKMAAPPQNSKDPDTVGTDGGHHDREHDGHSN